MSRRTARETAMRLFYEYSITDALNSDSVNELQDILKKDSLSSENLAYIEHVLQDFPQYREQIDAYIAAYSKSWTIDRISKVDLSILRLAMYEILYSDVPNNIIINEAVELAKQYSTEKSSAYINGVLGGFLKKELCQ